MEKFGLFDLIDKFNAQANGKKDLNKTPPRENSADKKGNGDGDWIEPQIFVPPHYAMNAKLQDFIKRHDEFAKNIPSNVK